MNTPTRTGRTLFLSAAVGIMALAAILLRPVARTDGGNGMESAGPVQERQASRTGGADCGDVSPGNHEAVPHADADLARDQGGCDPAAATRGLLQSILTTNHAAFAFYRKALLDAGAAATPSLTALLRCGVPRAEMEAMRLLLQEGSSGALTMVLARMLTVDLSSPEAEPYVGVFAECRDPSIARWLADSMGPEHNAKLRRQSALLLGIMGGSETVFSLGLAIESLSLGPVMTAQALETMAGRKNTFEVEALIDIFDGTQDPGLKVSAALALAGVGTPDACAFLLEVSQRGDSDADLALSVLPLVLSSYAQESLLRAARDSALPQATRVAAVSALQYQVSPNVRIVLSNVDIPVSDTELREAVALVLAEDGDGQERQPRGAQGEEIERCF